MSEITVVVTGDRHYADTALLFETLDQVHATRPIKCLVQGGARGADKIAEDWAKERSIHCIQVDADWKKHGKAAGRIRNKEMLEMSVDLVLGFHKDIGASKGTRNCLDEATKLGIENRLIA